MGPSLVFLAVTFLCGKNAEPQNQAVTANQTVQNDSEMAEQVLFCPHLEKCVYNYNPALTDSNKINSTKCCQPCDCDETCTGMECCVDILPCGSQFTSKDDQQKICIPSTFKQSHIADGILAISTCRSDSDEDERAKCLQQYNIGFVNASDMIPVTKSRTMEVYRNVHCALCNGVNAIEIEYWLLDVFCELKSTVDLTDMHDIFKAVVDTPGCGISYTNPYPNYQVERCKILIDRCNVTGLWEWYGSGDESYCLGNTIEYTNWTYMLFKNKGCINCNGLGKIKKGLEIKLKPNTPPFSLLFNLETTQMSETKRSTKCRPGMVFYKPKAVCVEARCSLLRRLRNNACERSIPNFESFTYRICLRLMPDVGLTIQTGLDLVMQLGGKLHDILRSVFTSIVNILYEILLISDLKFVDSLSTTEVLEANLRWYEVRIKVQNMETHDPEEKLKDLMRLSKETNLTVMFSDKLNNISLLFKDDHFSDIKFLNIWDLCLPRLVSFEPCPFFHTDILNFTEVMPSENLTVVRYNGQNDDDTFFEDFYKKPISLNVNILEFRTCAFVKIMKTEYPWKETDFGLHFLQNTLLVPFSEFVYAEDRETIWTCIENYHILMSAENGGASEYLLNLLFHFRFVISVLTVYCIEYL